MAFLLDVYERRPLSGAGILSEDDSECNEE